MLIVMNSCEKHMGICNRIKPEPYIRARRNNRRQQFMAEDRGLNLQHIYNIPEYIKGEYIWSYLCRIADANGFDDPGSMLDEVIPYHKIHAHKSKWAFDPFYHCLDIFFHAIGFDDWLEEGTLYTQMAPFISKETQIMAIRNVSEERKKDDALLDFPISYISRLKICPECRKEDEDTGVFYIHKEHQMPDLSICPKHHCRLLEAEYGCRYEILNPDRFKHFNNRSPMPVFEGDPGDHDIEPFEIGYADFCSYIMEHDLECSLEDVIRILADSRHKGNNLQNNKVDGYLYRHNGLRTILQVKSYAPRLRPVLIYGLVRICFSSTEKFFSRLEHKKPSSIDLFLKAAGSRFSLVGEYNENLVTVRCNICGSVFRIVPMALIMGFGCPRCDADIPAIPMFKRLFLTMFGNDYTYIDGFHRMGSFIRIQCKNSGEELIMDSRELLFRHVNILYPYLKGQPNSSVIFNSYLKEFSSVAVRINEKYRSAVNAVREFTFIDIRRRMNNELVISIMHNTCGTVFEVPMSRLYGDVRCPNCGVQHKIRKIRDENCIDHIPESDLDEPAILPEKTAPDNKRSDEWKQKRAEITRFINCHEGELIFSENLPFSNDDVRRYNNSLSRKTLLEQVAFGIYSHRSAAPEGGWSIPVLEERLMRMDDCVPICDSLLLSIGILVDNPKPCYSINLLYPWVSSYSRKIQMGTGELILINMKEPVTPETRMLLSVAMTFRFISRCSNADTMTIRLLDAWRREQGITGEAIRTILQKQGFYVHNPGILALMEEY